MQDFKRAGKSGGGSIATSTSAAFLTNDGATVFDVRGHDYFFLALKPATQALTKIDAIGYPNRSRLTEFVQADETGEYSTPVLPVDKASSGVFTLGAAAVGWVRFDVRALDTLTIAVTAAGTGTCAYSYHME